MRVLIAGAGDLGIRLALRLPATDSVYGLRRNTAALPARMLGVTVDLRRDPQHWPAPPEALDAVVYALTPSQRDEAGYREVYIDGLMRLRRWLLGVPRLIFVSSTAVYGQSAGEWVDEQSPAASTSWNGRVLLEAEAAARREWNEVVLLRLAGLYGPGRLWLQRRLQQGTTCQADPPAWTNRIHIDDAAALLECLLRHPAPPPLLIGVDREPAPECEVLSWLAGQLGLPAPRAVASAGASAGKRLRNDLAQSLGWQPRYPGYRAGYLSVLGELR